jgi:hypothetical protein
MSRDTDIGALQGVTKRTPSQLSTDFPSQLSSNSFEGVLVVIGADLNQFAAEGGSERRISKPEVSRIEG